MCHNGIAEPSLSDPRPKLVIMKRIGWAGRSLSELREFPKAITQEAGYQLYLMQKGELPKGTKPMGRIGKGCMELVINGNGTWYRILVSPTRDPETVWVLLCFQKKTNKTPNNEIELAQQRLRQIP